MKTSYRQLLVHVDGTARSSVRLDAAHALAQEHGAQLCALYAATASYIGMPFSPGLNDKMLVDLLAVDDKRRAAARAAFGAATAQQGAGAAWAEVTDMPVIGAFVQQALYADLLVLGQHDPQDRDSLDLPADFAQSVMADSGKPVLMVPSVGNLPARTDTIVIAWKESREAARAVAAALPLLQRAKSVHVLTWATPATDSCAGAVLSLETWLRAHGVQAQWHRDGAEPQQVGELILSRAFDLGADLLVMGCYSHTRAREWIMGGATRTVLQSMTLPVLMSH